MSVLSTGPLGPTESLRDRALEILRQAIVSGEIQVGELYSATALAKHLGVSVSPVREAMLTLVNDGIMEAVRNRGFRLVPLSAHDLDEVFELRMLLEVPAVTNLAGQDLTAEMPELRRRAIKTQQTAKEGDVNGFLASDRDFHLELLRLNGNCRLVNQVARLRDQTRLYGLPDLATRGLLTDSAMEHISILDAIEASDADAVREVMTHHLNHIKHEWATGTW